MEKGNAFFRMIVICSVFTTSVESAPVNVLSELFPGNIFLQNIFMKPTKPTGYLGNNGVLNIPRISTSTECRKIGGYCFYSACQFYNFNIPNKNCPVNTHCCAQNGSRNGALGMYNGR